MEALLTEIEGLIENLSVHCAKTRLLRLTWAYLGCLIQYLRHSWHIISLN